jgi:hypothetical protein
MAYQSGILRKVDDGLPFTFDTIAKCKILRARVQMEVGRLPPRLDANVVEEALVATDLSGD